MDFYSQSFHKLLCFGLLLACIQGKAYGIRNIDLALGWKEETDMKAIVKVRYLGDTSTSSSEKLGAWKNSAAGPSPFDPNETSKRRVQRGSDPIHNRC
ncbi:uncharacterized protein LOC122003630 [Zingiber officinale]|uniref:Uncharacterized protein n=1 Tax=Zingiber officinale TaxID=94328 RepID=A0A8J5KVJ2_ZINOF|nr:uncharacterized protein LOC122003630 [Zingiber officinale]KAG6492303.1 hypothetical protein ZIOFF_047257 [Zingiber officinale]